MQAALSYVLKRYFDEYVRGLDTNVDCSKLPATLHDLHLKHEKLNELIDDSAAACPFEFTDGVIGSVKLMPSWRGNLQVVASDVVLNLAFCPIKAMKKAMAPADDDEEDTQNQVPMNVQMGLCTIAGKTSPQVLSAQQVNQLVDVATGNAQQPAPQPPVQVAPRYCAMHDGPDKRRKAQPRSCQCSNCKMPVQTNYVEFALCPPCSDKERRCMCCGAAVDQPGAGVEQPRMAPRPALSAPGGTKLDGVSQRGSSRGGAKQAPRQPLPRYCPDHEVSEQRQKGEPRSVECRGCRAPLQTNYVEFNFCPICSEKEHKCMYCGADAASPSQPVPAGTAADISAGPPPPPLFQPDATLPPPPPWQPDPFQPLKSFGPAVGPVTPEKDELDMSRLKLGESMRLEEHSNLDGNSFHQQWVDRSPFGTSFREPSKPFGTSFGHVDEPDRRVGRQRSSSMPYRSSQVHPGTNQQMSLPGLPDREALQEQWGPGQWAMRPPRRSHQQLRQLAAMEC
mmetsp:Transcript_105594/g.193576  ORF Transcript_105594/g.193576 Transcript_105594/m.193576 type:complete len:507 (+) Transcript_105594:83-1603(+)